MDQIIPPTHCPACDSVLEFKNHILYCNNSGCSAQISKKLEHHLKTLKIKGLGPALISKIPVKELSEFYALSSEELANFIGSKTIADKVINQITIKQKSQLPFATFLASLNIPKFGLSVSKKLAMYASCLEELNEDTVAAANLGPKKTIIILNWLESENLGDAIKVEKLYNITNPKETSEDGPTVCITGKLKEYKNREEAKALLESKGVKVVSSVSKNVKYLIADTISSSSKFKKAKELSIPIVSINEFMELIS